MLYTVQKLAKVAGVSVRTLHHYDHIGLLKPSFVKENAYRYYENKELLKLQQILFLKELDFSLGQISQSLNAEDFNPLQALKDQYKLMKLKKRRLEKLLANIDQTIKNLKANKLMTTTDLYGSFTKEEFDAYKEEARQRWGNTEAYKQSQERTKTWTKQDYQRIAKEGTDIAQALAKRMDNGIKDAQVQDLIASHHKHIGQFYDCSYDMYRGLGQMYVDDPRFTAYYDKYKTGLAVFVRDAISFYCDSQSKAK